MTNSEFGIVINRSSAIRYRFRSLLLATLIVAVVAALLGAYYRGSNEAEQRSLLTLWSSASISFAIWMLGYVWGRHRAEKKVGTVRFCLPWLLCLRSRLISPKVYGVFFLITAAYLIIQTTENCVRFAERGQPLWLLVVLGLNPGLFLAIGLICIWWSKELWIGEKGIVLLSIFRPWGKIEEWHPHKRQSNTLVLTYSSGLLSKKIALRVSEQSRPQLEEFLHEKLDVHVT